MACRGSIIDGKLTHPTDAKTSKDFDNKHARFASDPTSVKLCVMTDGFNPFGNMSTQYSI